MNFLHSIVAGATVVGLFLGSLFGVTPTAQPQVVPVVEQQEQALGVALPAATANFESSLATGITNTATTLTLTSILVRGGTSLSGYVCLTIDEGSAQAEFVCGTASSTSVTGLTRGISPADGITEDTDLQFSHRRGATVKITDFPLIQRLKAQNSGAGTYESVLSYASGVTPSGGSELVDVEYVTSVITGTSTLSYNKIIVNGTAGETVVSGSIVYLKASDSRWYKADNDLQETYVDQELGIAQGAGTAGNSISGGVLTYGLDSTQSGMTGGNFVFLSSTAGAISSATTSQGLGKAISATTLFFDQNLIDSSVYVPTTFTGTTTFTGAVVGLASSTVRIATTSGTWTKPVSPTFKRITVEMVGAGGYGGDIAGNDGAAGGGGGAGGYAKFMLTANDLPSTVSYQIGASATTTSATTINSTWFSGFATTTGGTKPADLAVGAAGIAGGVGGTASVGVGNAVLTINGMMGVSGMSAGAGAWAALSGSGGSTPLGIGGAGQSVASTALGGQPALGYGAGGGGSVTSAASSATGGAGGTGVIIITEYY